MKMLAAALLLALAFAGPARAAICHQQVELAADPRWAPQDGDNCDMCDFNYVGVGPGERLRWNGADVSETTLAQYLEIVANMEPRPVTLLLIGRAADCALLARIVTAIETHGDCGPGERCAFGLALPTRPPPRRR
jgi:hypothetical protein